MPERDPFDEIEAFYETYLDTFSAGDLPALDPMFEYPYLLSDAEGVREIPDSGLYRSIIDSFQGTGYARSRFDSFRKLRMGHDRAMVFVDYTRVRQDGSIMKTAKGAYILRHRPDGWKIVAMFDNFGGQGRD
jgi:hypothetical protein